MTDLPADPSAWDLNDEATDVQGALAPDEVALTAGGETRSAPRVDLRTLDDSEPNRLPVPVVYDTIDTYTPKVSWKALVGPLVAVAVVSIGLGLVMARGGNDDKTAAKTAGSATSTASVTTVVSSTSAAVVSTAAPATVAPTTAAPTTAAPVTAPPTTAVPAPDATVAPDAQPAPDSVAPPPPDAAPVTDVDLANPVRYAEFTDGKVYLHGRVPSAELAQTIIDKVAAVVGKDNVVVDYVVDPSTPAVSGGPLKVTNTVQFEPDSTSLRPEFASILGLGIRLMNQNPSVQIIVIGRADARGGSGYNQRLSQARAEAVVQYLVSSGADGERLTIDARGASDPLAEGDDLAANAANRSVEFIILGLIG